MMTFAEKFPDPDPMPPDPGEAPPISDGDNWRAWQTKARAYNGHLMKKRKHRIAVCVDTLSQKMKDQDGKLEATDNIAHIVGVMFLDGTLHANDSLDPFSFLGGIF
jgi:hypothetical protein